MYGIRLTAAGSPFSSAASAAAARGPSFTPASSTYSKVILRPCVSSAYARHAAMRAAIGMRAAAGISAARTLSSAAWSETASLTWGNSRPRASRRPGTPTVDTVMRRAPTAQSAPMAARNPRVPRQFKSGSPMPISTMPLGAGVRPPAAFMSRYWSRISPGARKRWKKAPEAQNPHPTGQPLATDRQ